MLKQRGAISVSGYDVYFAPYICVASAGGRLKAWEQTGLRASCEAARRPAGSSGEQLSLQRSLARAEEQAI